MALAAITSTVILINCGYWVDILLLLQALTGYHLASSLLCLHY